MLVILAIAGATLATLLYSLFKNAGKEDELEKLLEEEKDPTPPMQPVSGDEPESRQPWEKDSDWWKQ